MEYANLLKIQDLNSPSIVTLLPDDKTYFINLNTREIEKVNTIIVETDHRSSTIYFKAHRYFDNMDLANTVCIVQYETAEHGQKLYAVPYYDIETYSNGDSENNIEGPLILFPWVISECVTPKDGIVKFSIRFYQIDTMTSKLTYSLSTLPTQLEIKPDIGFKLNNIQTEDEFAYLQENYLVFLQNAAQAAQEGSLTWIVI